MTGINPRYEFICSLILSLVLSILGTGCSGKPLMVALMEKSIPKDVEPITVRAEIIQANTCLYERDSKCDAPAQVAFTLDPNVSTDDLKQLAKFAFSLKDTVTFTGWVPGDSDEKRLARQVKNETYIPDRFWKVPRSLSRSDMTYLTGVWIERKTLSEGFLRKSSLECHLYLAEGEPSAIRFVREAE